MSTTVGELPIGCLAGRRMTDHNITAEELLADSHHLTGEFADRAVAQAQVHATLHLAEVIAQKGANQ